MATKLGSLQVQIKTNGAQFQRDMKKSSSSVSNFSKKINVTRIAVVALAGASGIGLLINSTLKANDALAKTAEKLGLTTQALVGLRHAAELSGVGATTLDMAIQRMTRRLAEAANGTGEAKDALKELGLNAKQLSADSPDEAFIKIARAMQDVASEGDKVRLSFKLFDSEGVALKNTLALGEQGLRDATAEATAFGLALNSIETKAVEDFNDEMTRAKASASGLATAVSVSLAPIIEQMARGFQVATKAIREYFGIEFVDDTKKLAALEQERLKLATALDAVITDMGPKERAAAKERLLDIRDEIELLLRKKDIETEAAERKKAAADEPVDDKAGDDAFVDELLSFMRHNSKMEREAQRSAAARERIEQATQDKIVNMRMSAFQHAASFIRALAPESKKAAIAALAIEKGLAIAQVLIDTEVAAMNVRKYGDPATSEINAGRIRTLGAISVGFIAGTGLAQAASINSGGSSTPVTVAGQTSSESAFDPFNTPTQSGSITINVNGVVTDEIVQDLIVPAIQDAVADRDIILISNDSRNGQELLG